MSTGIGGWLALHAVVIGAFMVRRILSQVGGI